MIWTIVAAFLWWWAAFTIKIIEDAHWAGKSVPSKSLFLYLAWPLLPLLYGAEWYANRKNHERRRDPLA